MPTFIYTARDSAGQSINGSVVADTVALAIRQIRGEGKYPISIRSSDDAPQAAAAAEAGGPDIRIGRADVIHIATQLSVMVETGVTLAEALECIARQADKPNVRELVNDLSEQLQAGSSFSDALARHPRSFPTLFLALMKAAEKTGMLSRLLNRATAYLRQEQETLRRVRGALTYPCIMFAFAVTTTVFLLAFVLPRFTVIYAAKQAALPLPTQILMSASDFLVQQWMGLVTGIASILILGAFYVRTDGGRRTWHYIQLYLPLLGSLYRKAHLTRGLHMVGTMAGAGVGLMDCVSTAHDLCANVYFRDLWRSVADQIQGGRQLSEPLFRSPLVPGAVAQMIYSGEKSGKLAVVMEQVSTFAEEELKEQIEQLTRYIEPAMICVMGVIIGGVSLAMLLPVFTISRVMAH
jgi:type IV pilus assembly protein PilC